MAKFPTYDGMVKNVAEEALDGYIYKGKTLREWVDVLAQTQWIPCNERLPEEDGQYLITVKYKHVDGYVDIYAEHGEWFERKWDMLFGHCGEVEAIIAWMPLPEPYKSEIPTGAVEVNE